MYADPLIKHALASAFLISLSGAPLGVMLVLRRMSLMGDVIAHAILPGTAAGFILAGMSMPVMGLGGFVAGLLVALIASLATRYTAVREDANLATFYLLAVALGVALLALHGSAQNLEDILFGDATSIDDSALTTMGVITSLTLLTFAVIYRPLVVESFDPTFMRALRAKGGVYHALFMGLVVMNMVEGYRTLGTLMASGLVIIPAVTAQFWTRRLSILMLTAILIAVTSSVMGITLATRLALPSGPSIVLILGGFYVLSALIGRVGSLRARYFPPRHLQA